MNRKIEKGFVHIYTGNGKGKSTAAFGLAVRAVGAGLKVFIAQFMKAGNYSEIKALKQLKPAITIQQFGTGKFVKGKPSQADINAAIKGLDVVRRVLREEMADVVIMDEINTAISVGIVKAIDVLELIDKKPVNVEIILTGRNAPPLLVKKADLVTEMKEIKHYYKKGVRARRGIEF